MCFGKTIVFDQKCVEVGKTIVLLLVKRLHGFFVGKIIVFFGKMIGKVIF